jgi:dihydroorotate dehydrogenase
VVVGYCWVREAREKHGISIPINAGGGILKTDDVDRMKAAGASSIFVGSAAFLRAWRVRGIINRANQIFSA